MSRSTGSSSRLWALFAVSSVAFLVVMSVSPMKDYLREYRSYQTEYRRLLLDNAGTAKELEAVRKEGVRVRQIWIPEFGDGVDRCTSCHLGVDNPIAAAFRPPLQTHPTTAHTPNDIQRFGCVVCHGGQGRATTKEEAHGHVEDWSRPILPVRYTEAGCGKCHLDDRVPEASMLTRGRRFMREYGCYACHQVPQRAAWKTSAPDLDGIREKVNVQWLKMWLQSPRAMSPSARMPDFALSAAEIDSLAAFLWSLDPKPGALARMQEFNGMTEGDAAAGKRLFRVSRCISCHTVEGKGNGSAPELGTIGSKSTREWIAAFLSDPHAFQPDTAMPAYDFSRQDVLNLAQYFYEELYNPDAPESQESPRFSLGAVRGGERAFQRYGCGSCHRVGGRLSTTPIGPDLTAVGSKSVSLLDFGRRSELPRTLPDWLAAKVREPRSFADGLRMPRFDLDPEAMTAVITALLARTDDRIPASARVSSEAAEYTPPGRFGELATRYRCMSCHEINGVGGDISQAPLTVEGSRVHRDWMEDYILGPSTIRPILTDRMVALKIPQEEAAFIADFITNVYVDPEIPAEPAGSQATGGDPARGRRLFSERYGCQACHMIAGEGGYYGPLLDHVGIRLKSSWLVSWMQNPQRSQADIRCPNYGMADADGQDIAAFLETLGKNVPPEREGKEDR